MKTTTDILDSLVRGLKATGEFEGVRFVHSRKRRHSEKPLSAFLVACGVGSEETSDREESFCSQLKMYVYAPATAGDRELSLLCQSLSRALWQADEDGNVLSVRMGEVSYDSDMAVLCRVLTVMVGTAAEEKPQDESPKKELAPVYLDGVAVEGVLALSVSEEYPVYPVREMLSRPHPGEIPLSPEFILKLTVDSSRDVAPCRSAFTVTVGDNDNAKSYFGCVVTNIDRKAEDDGSISVQYRLRAESSK